MQLLKKYKQDTRVCFLKKIKLEVKKKYEQRKNSRKKITLFCNFNIL